MPLLSPAPFRMPGAVIERHSFSRLSTDLLYSSHCRLKRLHWQYKSNIDTNRNLCAICCRCHSACALTRRRQCTCFGGKPSQELLYGSAVSVPALESGFKWKVAVERITAQATFNSDGQHRPVLASRKPSDNDNPTLQDLTETAWCSEPLPICSFIPSKRFTPNYTGNEAHTKSTIAK